MFNKYSLLIHKKQTVQTVQKARRKRILMYTMQNGGHKYEYTLIHICVFVLFGEFRSTTPKEPFFLRLCTHFCTFCADQHAAGTTSETFLKYHAYAAGARMKLRPFQGYRAVSKSNFTLHQSGMLPREKEEQREKSRKADM